MKVTPWRRGIRMEKSSERQGIPKAIQGFTVHIACPYDRGHGSATISERVMDAKLCNFDVPDSGWRHFEEIYLRTFFVKTAAEHSRELILTDRKFQEGAKK